MAVAYLSECGNQRLFQFIIHNVCRDIIRTSWEARFPVLMCLSPGLIQFFVVLPYILRLMLDNAFKSATIFAHSSVMIFTLYRHNTKLRR